MFGVFWVGAGRVWMPWWPDVVGVVGLRRVAVDAVGRHGHERVQAVQVEAERRVRTALSGGMGTSGSRRCRSRSSAGSARRRRAAWARAGPGGAGRGRAPGPRCAGRLSGEVKRLQGKGKTAPGPRESSGFRDCPEHVRLAPVNEVARCARAQEAEVRRLRLSGTVIAFFPCTLQLYQAGRQPLPK
jgi:hypothetical protein